MNTPHGPNDITEASYGRQIKLPEFGSTPIPYRPIWSYSLRNPDGTPPSQEQESYQIGQVRAGGQSDEP